MYDWFKFVEVKLLKNIDNRIAPPIKMYLS